MVYIYKIINIKNKKVYIGSAKKLTRRHRDHLISRGLHESSLLLQKAIDKYGIENFKWEILEYISIDKLIEREQYYLDLYKPFADMNNGYNICKVAGSCVGIKHSQEFKEMRRKLATKQMNTPKAKKRLRQITLDLWKNPEFILKQLKSRNSNEYRELRSKIAKQRWENPEERAKFVEIFNTTELKQKSRELMLRRWENPEYREARRKQQVGNSFALDLNGNKDKIIKFCKSNGYIPNARSKNEEEKRLGRAFIGMKRTKAHLDFIYAIRLEYPLWKDWKNRIV